MSNNKQQTAVEYLVEQLFPKALSVEQHYHIEQAKEMEVMGKEMSYADGYAEGYKRALDYMTMSIKNAIETK